MDVIVAALGELFTLHSLLFMIVGVFIGIILELFQG